MFIKVESVPQFQGVEERHGVGQSRSQVPAYTLTGVFEMAYMLNHRIEGFNNHALIPLDTRYDFEVAGIALGGMKITVGQDDHALFKLLNQGQES